MLFWTPNELLSDLAGRARALRLVRKLQQSELAKRAGVGLATVQRFEKTGHASIENVVRIAIALSAEEPFTQMFEQPPFETLDEVLATPEKPRQRAPKRTS